MALATLPWDSTIPDRKIHNSKNWVVGSALFHDDVLNPFVLLQVNTQFLLVCGLKDIS